MLRITSVVVTITLAACAVDDEPETETAVQAVAANCDIWGCGENSPVLGPFVDWWELHARGQVNNKGLRVDGFYFTPGGTKYQPLVYGDRLYAFHPNGTRLTGLALQGGFLVVRPAASPTIEYRIHITKVNPKPSSNVVFWIGPATQIETYELMYTGGASTQIQRLCTNPPDRDSGEGPGRVWYRPFEALFIAGDRYVRPPAGGPLELVTGTAAQDWFTIGCPGSVAAKMHLNRQTEAGATSGYYAPLAMRQAMLRMYVSDVCGNGKAWTEAGTKIHFEQAGNFAKLVGDEFAFESQWGPNGALCMDTHRLGMLNLAGINAACAPQPCNGNVAAPAFWAGSYVVSAVPFDPN